MFKQVAVKIDDDKYILSTDEVAVDAVGSRSVIPLKSFVVYSELFKTNEGMEVNLLQPITSKLLQGLPVFNKDQLYMGKETDIEPRDYFKSVPILEHL